MSPVQANCPACGAPITFNHSSSFVLVCEYCNSAIARGDRKLEDLGKVIDLVATGSPLDIGLKGNYHGVGFELTGHSQLSHEAGGIWDEWYAAFTDGRWGWISEAQGQFYVLFPVSFPEQNQIPPFDRLRLGHSVPLPGSVPLVVGETGEALAKGARGEIPYRFTPGDRYFYADLSGPSSEFATIDYSESPPLVFIGRQVELAELGVAHARVPERDLKSVAAAQLNCPNCAGPLSLVAPDKAERVTCPNCNSLLDVNNGKLSMLQTLQQRFKPEIPLGSIGEFYGKKLTLIGFMQRSTLVEGVTYKWDEYLLYHPQVGFHWLMANNGHWSYIKPLPPGQIKNEGTNKVIYRNKTFKLFDSAVGVVDYVLGEFYWKVTPGERTQMADYIAPPEMLSQEMGMHNQRGEVNWSLGTYLTAAEVNKAFGITTIPTASSRLVAPNQPFPYPTGQIYAYWGIFSLITISLWILFSIFSGHQTIMDKSFDLPPLTNNTEATQTVFTDPFELKARKNIKVTVTAPGLANNWLYLEGDFYDDSTGLAQNFSVPVEYYYGVEGGESWSEGGTSADVFISALPAGQYTLRLEAMWGNWQQPASVAVRVEQGEPRSSYPIILLLLLSVIPFMMLTLKYSFEVRRWKESPYNPYQSSSE